MVIGKIRAFIAFCIKQLKNMNTGNHIVSVHNVTIHFPSQI